MDLRFVQDLAQTLHRPDQRTLGSHFTRAELPGWGDRLLTPTGLLDLLTYRTFSRPGQVLCLSKGVFLPPRDYMVARTTRGDEHEMIDTYRLGALLKEGCQIVVGGLEKIDPRFDLACRALQWLTGAKVYATAFLATGDAGGFNLHVDTSDSVILQLAGSKSWEVRGETLKAPLNEVRRTATPSEEVLWRGSLAAGDLMCVPRGYWHTATRTDQAPGGYSLHVTFGIVERTGMDWLRALTERANHVEPFRHDVSEDTDPRDLVRLLTALAEQYPPAAFARAQPMFLDRGGLGLRENQRVITRGVFGPATGVACLTEFRPRLTAAGDTVTVASAGRTLTFPAQARPALDALLSGLPVQVAELAARTGLDVAAYARTLLDAGLCVEVTDALASAYSALS
ncbi:cupin domain-containing protein [Streptomyces sp. NPDC049949]|uniref:JmjC domain-containing protein n=1 Tax=Streptomyces sp. NPDC049949 TaxID=3154627 RepID=UPI003431DB96